jgi:hypothetical protein
MWAQTDENGNTKEFAGTQNVWIKRFGLLIVIVGLFPVFAATYWDQIHFIGKWIIIFAIASFAIFHIRRFLKSIFKSNG